MIPIAKPQIDEEEIDAVTEVMRSGNLAEGPKVRQFEESFTEYTGSKYAVAVNSGTAALHIALLAHGIGAGDEVITTPFTFIATANSILFTGAKPVFADITEDTFNIDPEMIKKKITSKTKAILPVHLYGQPADMDEIKEIAEDHDLIVIEDACQAHGAEINNRKAGSEFCAAFSFYPTKNMTTGEGGMLTTNDEEIASKSRMIRSHGSRQRYYHELLGFNFRMTDISAAIGLVQLKKLESFIQKRQNNAEILTDGLNRIEGIIPPVVRSGCKHVFHQYTIRVTDKFKITRDELVNFLNKNDIGTGIHYPLPVHKQPLYKTLYNGSYSREQLPVAEKIAKEVVSLPVHPMLDRSDLNKIISTIREAGL